MDLTAEIPEQTVKPGSTTKCMPFRKAPTYMRCDLSAVGPWILDHCLLNFLTNTHPYLLLLGNLYLMGGIHSPIHSSVFC